MTAWVYKGAEFTSSMIGDSVGFVYVVTDETPGMKYIGKKLLVSKKKRPPLKGKKRKRIEVVETDWKDYFGSSEEVKRLVEHRGREKFSREIVRLCRTKGEMSYYEAKLQFDTECLFKPDEYHNAFIGCKIHRRHVHSSNHKK